MSGGGRKTFPTTPNGHAVTRAGLREAVKARLREPLPRMHASPPGENPRDLLGGRSQADIARASGVSPQAIGLIFDGRRDPRISTAAAIAAACGVGLERLARALVRAQEHAAARERARLAVARLTR